MAGKTGGSPPHLDTDLKSELLREGHAFSFFQVIRLLCKIALQSSDPKRSPSDSLGKIRIKPNLSLAFPASDVESIKELGDQEDPWFLITANFLGLYGSASPLPTFYSEELIAEAAEDESVSRDFIDILNQRLFDLLFECWSKYRQFLQVVEQEDSEHIDRLFCLLGLGERVLRREIPEPHRLFCYIGLFTQSPHSAMGLKTLLKDALSGIDVDVIPCIERMVKIPDDQIFRFGISGCKLGIDTFMGDEVIDRMGKFRIRLGPLSRSEFKRLTPGTKAFKRISSLTDFYFVEPLEYDVELIMAKGQAQTVCLGDVTRATLGVDSWIFSSPEMGEVRAIFNPQRN